MNRILLLTYARPIVPAECVIAAVNSVSAAFLGRDGVVSVTDAVKDDRACVLVLVNGPLDNVLARLPQNVAGVPVFALQSDALQPLADAPAFASAGDPAASGKPPWADSTDNHPVNPFALARLMTGKVVKTRDELVAAFGMPLDKILAVGGPLYAPDLAAIAARRSQSANVATKKPAGAPSGNKITPPSLSAPKSIAIRASDATKVRDWVTPVQDPTGPGHYDEGPTASVARRAWSNLNTHFPCPNGVCDTCRDWRRLSPDAKRELLLSYQFSADGVTRENVAEVVANIDARCATIASSASYRGVRDHNRLLTATGHGTNDWAELTCQQQFDALARINADLVPPRVTIDEMKRELWQQWAAIEQYSPSPRGNWFDWAFLGSYAERQPSVTDPHQGCVGNCFLIASIAGTAWVRPEVIAAKSWRGVASASAPSAFARGIGAEPRPSVTIAMADPRGGSLVNHDVVMNDRLPIVIDSYDLCAGPRPFCHTDNNNQTWPDLYEKAMRVWVSGRTDPPMTVSDDPASDRNSQAYFIRNDVHPAVNIAGGDGQTAINWLGASARNSTASGWLANIASTIGVNPTIDTIWRYLDAHCDASGKIKSVVFAGTIPLDWSPPVGIVPQHAYTLLGIDRARRMVYLRNPWGRISPGAQSDQRGTWMGLTLGRDDGVGAVTLQSFYDNFSMVSGNYYGAPQMNDFGLLFRWDFRDV